MMSIEKMRKKLSKYCDERLMANPNNLWDTCDRCIFCDENCDFPVVSDDAIERMYNMVFGKSHAKTMTCREWMRDNKPDNVDKRFKGGVSGCPYNFYLIKNKSCLCNGSFPEYKKCTACWDQPIEYDPNEASDKTHDQKLFEAFKLTTHICDRCGQIIFPKMVNEGDVTVILSDESIINAYSVDGVKIMSTSHWVCKECRDKDETK